MNPESEFIPRQLLDQVPKQTYMEALRRYDSWRTSLTAETSILNHRLYFLQLLEEETPGTPLKTNERIIDLLLDDTGVPAVGEEVERPARDGGTKKWKVLWRKIGSRYGVEMGIRAEDGEVVSGEFFD